MTYKLFIGYDSEVVSPYHTLASSIIRRSSVPLAITPLCASNMKSIYTRPRNNISSTEFSFSRFLTPYLSNYEGVSIFMDNDMVVTKDIKELFDLFDDRYAVQVVKHNYETKDEEKFLGQVQTKYEKKNWSSVIIFNNKKCKALTPEVVNSESGLFLHQFKWLENEDLIGEIPLEWNFLVDEYQKPKENPALLHYTLGGPYFDDYQNCDYADLWISENKYMNSCAQPQQIKVQKIS